MKTAQNRAKIFAVVLRAAAQELRANGGARQSAASPDVANAYANALESIDAVAEELEQLAAAPDPDGGTRGA